MQNLRICLVKDNVAYFHGWSEKASVVEPSPFAGGHMGGVIKDTVGIVEFEDGQIHECYPYEVKFIMNPPEHSMELQLAKEFVKNKREEK